MVRWLLLGLIACEPVPPSTVADVQFAEGFAFDTHARVTLDVRPGDVDPATVRLDVTLPTGEPLFQGTAAEAMARPPALEVPRVTTVLYATARRPDGTGVSFDLDVVDGHATLDLGGAP